MPVATIHLLKGHPRPALAQVVREVAQAYAQIMGSPIDRVQVWIDEIDPALWAVGDVTADEAIAQRGRRAVEVPFVRIVLMEGRPVEQVHASIAAITEILGRVLGVDPARVRVLAERVRPDHWGIGGTPASVVRSDEVEARERAG